MLRPYIVTALLAALCAYYVPDCVVADWAPIGPHHLIGSVMAHDPARAHRDLQGQAVQLTERPRTKEEEELEANRRERQEDARFARTCDPLKVRILSILESAGNGPSQFNRALDLVRDVGKLLPSSCPGKITIFAGTITNVIYCFNDAVYIELADGGTFVWTKETRTFNGRPQAEAEFVMGLTAAPYFCIKSILPNVVVYPAMLMSAVARRNWDYGDRALYDADQARVRSKKLIAELSEKLQRDPWDAASFSARGAAYLNNRDYERAISDFDQFTTLQPNNPAGWNNRCYARALGNRELLQALEQCNRSLQINPQNATALDSRGIVYLRLGELEKSIADYDAALKLNPALAPALFGRGLAKQKKGDRAGAEADMSAAKNINVNIGDEFASHGLK